MEEKDLSEAVFHEFHRLKADGVDLGSSSMVMFNLQSSMMTSCPATLILPAQSRAHGFIEQEVIRGTQPSLTVPETTAETLWNCTKEHYGLTIATAVTAAAGIPISKTAVGTWVHAGSSKTTNLTSLIGMRFFPRTLIRQPTVARMAKATFGTVRVFGVIGRGIPFVAAGLAVFDLVSIGLCAYEAKNGR
jgi:hypothetical protein